TRKTNTGVGQTRELEGEVRAGHVEHDRCRGHGYIGEQCFLLDVGDDAAVYNARIAFAATGGDLHARIEQLGNVAAPDNGGNTHLTCHDGRMAGTTTLVGDDGACLL